MRTSPFLPAALTAIATFGLFAACDRKDNSGGPTTATETEDAREAAIQDAFASSDETAAARDATNDPGLRTEIDEYFTALGQAFRKVDSDRIMELISVRSILAYAEKSGYAKFGTGANRRAFLKGAEEGFRGQFVQSAQLMGFDDHIVRKIDAVRDGEVVAYVRLWDENVGVYTKMRWWLLRDGDGKWAAYDYEDLEQSIRISVLLGSMMSDPKELESYVEPLQRTIAGMQSLLAEDVDDAQLRRMRKDVEDILRASPPEGILLFAHFLKYAILSYQEKYDEALAALDEMEAIDPKSPIIHYGRGNLYSIAEKGDEAIASYTRYAELLGWDPDICEMISDLYFEKEDLEASAKYARLGIADDPNAAGCVASLAAALPPAEIEEVLAAIARAKDPESTFDLVLSHLLGNEAGESARLVYDALKSSLPESELVGAYAEDFEDTDPEKAE